MIDRPDRARVNEAIGALDDVAGEWLRRPGVTAVDVGFKIRGREITDEVSLRAHVARKLPSAELAESSIFNESDDQHTFRGFPIDVIEATYGVGLDSFDTIDVNPLVRRGQHEPLALEDPGALEMINRRSRIRPVMGGFSCANDPRVTAGTIGGIVFHRQTCEPMILSNWHVLAGSPAAAIGELVIQPGQADGGAIPGDGVARLSAMVLDNRMDAAVARLLPGVGYEREVLGLGVISGTSEPVLGLKVVKSGRSTATTQGIIDGVSMRTRINYGTTVNTFTNQIRIVPRPPWPAANDEISSGGDSGSIWMTETNRAVGLHFAGEIDPSITAENAIASPIKPIMDEFDISFSPVVRRNPPPDVDPCRRHPELWRIRIPWPLPLSVVPPAPPSPVDPGPWADDWWSVDWADSPTGWIGDVGQEPASFAHGLRPAGCSCGSTCDNAASKPAGFITLGQLLERLGYR